MRNVTWKRKKRTSKGNEWLLSHLNGKLQDTLSAYLFSNMLCCLHFLYFFAVVHSLRSKLTDFGEQVKNLLLENDKLVKLQKEHGAKVRWLLHCLCYSRRQIFIGPHPLLLYNKYHIYIRASDHDMSGIISLIFHHFSIRSRRWPRNPREGVYNTLRLNPNSVRSSQQSEVVWRSWRGMKRSWRKS